MIALLSVKRKGMGRKFKVLIGLEGRILHSDAVREHQDNILVCIQLGTEVQVPVLQQPSCLFVASTS